jgi:hypothetical protein
MRLLIEILLGERLHSGRYNADCISVVPVGCERKPRNFAGMR